MECAIFKVFQKHFTGHQSMVPSIRYIVQLYALLLWIYSPVLCHGCQLLSIYGRKTADCTNRNLLKIPTDLENDLQVLKFNDNQLTFLRMDEFKHYPALQQISLVRNRIEIIAPDAFRALYNLQKLDLEGNKIKSIKSTIFQHLRSVRILNLKSNPLTFLTKDAFSKLVNIEELNFENCWLERIDPQTFKGLNNLNEINLVNNELKTLDPMMEKYMPSSLTVFRLHRNPWICDCNIRWLRSYLEDNKIGWDFINNVPTCNSPEILKNLVWRGLAPDKFSCAAQIVTARNASTSIELEVHGNVTIDCVVRGDPRPTITWMKRRKYVNLNLITQRQCDGEDGQKQICSSLNLKDLSLSDEGDYRCIAQNNAGRSEITYKLWVHDPTGIASATLYGLTSETLIGIGIGAGVLVLLVVACIIWMVNRHDQRNGKRAYKSHNYKKQARNGQENHSPPKNESSNYQVEEEVVPVITDVKEKDKTTTVIVNSELAPVNHIKVESSTIEPKPTTQENHIKPEKNNDFKMKIFSPDSNQEERSHVDGEQTVIDTTESNEKTPLCNNKSTAGPKKPEPVVVDIVVPDVVQRPDDKRTANHRPVAPPTVQVPVGNHIQSHPCHKRAEENPYAKLSDMKPVTNKSQSAKDKKKDTVDTLVKEPVNGHKNSETVNGISKKHKSELCSPSKSGNSITEKKKVTTFALDNSPCKNPVCLKEHNGGGSSRSQSPTKKVKDSPQNSDMLHPGKQHIKNSQSMGGISMTDKNNCGTTSPTHIKADQPPNQDRYKTLPNRPKVYTPMDDSRLQLSYGKPRKYPSKDDQTLPQSKYALGHHYSGSGAHIELPRAAKTATIASPRQLPPILRNPHHEPTIHGFQPSQPPDPIPSHIRSKTLTPKTGSRSSTGSHGDRPASSPIQGRKLPKAFESTSLDDLLSPPFGHIQVERPKSPRTQAHKLPKPGEKDEYGTAV